MAADLTLVAGEGLQALRMPSKPAVAATSVAAERAYTVYQAINEAGEAAYVGMTAKLEQRAAAHLRIDRVINEIPGSQGLTVKQARGV